MNDGSGSETLYADRPGIILPPLATLTGRPIEGWNSWAGSMPNLVGCF